MTTFAPLTEETENEVVITDDQLLTTNSTTILLEDDDEDQSETDLRQKNELTTEENDHPYDEIPGVAKKKQDLVIANTFTIKSEAVDSKKEEEEEEEDDKVYDEIPPPMTPDDSSNTSQGIIDSFSPSHCLSMSSAQVCLHITPYVYMHES